ncbi:hypothetical protein M1N67_01800 [Peptococcaceae bacterium]|nr:hypothetical protein [Peptococcaceae bacterium]
MKASKKIEILKREDIFINQFLIGLITLAIVLLLIYFGLAHRVLDRMKLSDRAALGIIVLLIIR